MKPLPLQDLAAAVSSYLTYLSSVTHLDNLIDEGTIKYPFVEYLERKIRKTDIFVIFIVSKSDFGTRFAKVKVRK